VKPFQFSTQRNSDPTPSFPKSTSTRSSLFNSATPTTLLSTPTTPSSRPVSPGPFTSKLRSGSRTRSPQREGSRNHSPSPDRGRQGGGLCVPEVANRRGVSPTPLGNLKKDRVETGKRK